MNDFHIYNKNRAIYLDIIQHSATSETTLDTFIANFYNKEDTSDFDLLHLILKHGRNCQECNVEMRYTELFPLVINNVNKEPPYPLLICMIDLLKNDITLLDTSTLHSFLETACLQWTHRKIYQCRKSMELCTLLAPVVHTDVVLLNAILAYIHLCRQHISQQDIDRFKSIDYTEFFFSSDSSRFTFDRVTCKLLIELVLCTLLKQDLNLNYINTIHKQIINLYEVYTPREVKELLFTIYCANDDDTIHLLDKILTIYQQGQYKQLIINPHSLFLYFLGQCGNTHDIMVDLLLENDSEFLMFFHRYIIFATQDIEQFKQEAGAQLEVIQTIVAQLILVLEGDGFPYNTKPLIRRLLKFEESLYL